MINVLRNKIYEVGSTVTVLSNKFFYEEAPAGTENPYAVFNLVTNASARDSGSEFEESYVQINFYHNTASAAETMYDDFKNKFVRSEFENLTGYKLVLLHRQFDRGPKKINENWQLISQYKIELQKQT